MKRRAYFVLALTCLGLSAAVAETARAQDFMRGNFKQQSGEDLYKGVCQGCHMPDAKGAVGAGAYPALAGDIRLAQAIYPIAVVVNGQRGMPAFGDLLTDAQIALVLNFIRTHFGNRFADAVQPEAVKAARR